MTNGTGTRIGPRGVRHPGEDQRSPGPAGAAGAAGDGSRSAVPPRADGFDPWVADLRCQVTDRMRMMNTLHADHAWLARHRDPIGAHAVAFFYSEPFDPARPGFALRTATRLVLDGQESQGAARLLFELAEVARGYRRAGALDPRTQMATRCEPMSAHAAYIGVGLSTLDTPAGAWERIRASATGPLTIPGRCLVILADATLILAERGRHHEPRNFVVYATAPLDDAWGQSLRAWQLAPYLAETADAATGEIWQRLAELHRVISEADRG